MDKKTRDAAICFGFAAGLAILALGPRVEGHPEFLTWLEAFVVEFLVFVGVSLAVGKG